MGLRVDIHCRYCTVYRMFLCSPHRISKWTSGIGWQYTGESHLSYSVHRIGHDFSPFPVVHMGFPGISMANLDMSV